MVKVPPFAVPQLGSCASSGRAWRPWAARHSQKEAEPLGAQPPPRVLELAASNAADLTACDHAGKELIEAYVLVDAIEDLLTIGPAHPPASTARTIAATRVAANGDERLRAGGGAAGGDDAGGGDTGVDQCPGMSGTVGRGVITSGMDATVVDLCSGKGFFSLVLALEYPRLRVIAVDSNAAIKTGHFGLLPNLSFLRADVTSVAFASDLAAALGGDNQRTVPPGALGVVGSTATAETQASTMADRALVGAAEMGDHDVLMKALKDGARLDAVDERAHTALHWAARWGRVDDIAALVAAGAPLNARTKAGVTPLIYAASDGWEGCVSLLLNAGALTLPLTLPPTLISPPTLT